MHYRSMFIVFVFSNFALSTCDIQIGPDPWDYVSNVNSVKSEENIPPDLREVPVKKVPAKTIGTGEWFFKRILAIILKGGQVKKNEDGNIDISLQMRYKHDKWTTLEDYITSDMTFSEDMFRRSVGYVEEAIINKPTIMEEIRTAWSEYIHYYLTEYKMHFTWATSILAGIITMVWSWKRVSHKHVIIIVIIALYSYEVFISYKEAEKKELDRFLTAVNTCKWYFWTSSCEVPPPDPIIFLKYMNPLKIGVRMFTTLLSEPMITLSETIQIIIHGVTDGLWFPVNKLMYVFLILVFNGLLIFLLVMVLFNYILNIPFSFNFLGVLSICFKQRNRTIHSFASEPSQPQRLDNADRISGENLSKLLDVYNRALSTAQSARSAISSSGQHNSNLPLTYKCNMKRSASAGRLPSLCNNNVLFENTINRDGVRIYKQDGGGDAL